MEASSAVSSPSLIGQVAASPSPTSSVPLQPEHLYRAMPNQYIGRIARGRPIIFNNSCSSSRQLAASEALMPWQYGQFAAQSAAKRPGAAAISFYESRAEPKKNSGDNGDITVDQ